MQEAATLAQKSLLVTAAALTGAQHPLASGLRLISDNTEALAARVMLARRATQTLDLQYYYWRPDHSGQLLAKEVLKAADRGVQVRILLDDLNTGGRDSSARALTSHQNIEVRFFNPSRHRENKWRRNLELLFKFTTSTRRMHNKAWIADGCVGIVGGRNVGDAYFGAADQTTFADLDILAVGPVVAEMETAFTRYWQSKGAVKRRPWRDSSKKLRKLRISLDKAMAEAPARHYENEIAKVLLHEPLLQSDALHWTQEARIIADPPEKALGRLPDQWMAQHIAEHIGSAREQVNITSPYFIPGVEGLDEMRALRERGVDVSVLTNSLASTDVAAVHGAYAKYRLPMLKLGVKLFKLRPTSRKQRISPFGSSTASLHTKAYTVDGESGFVGSYNFDPRSKAINTEMGIQFRHPALVREIDAVFTEQCDRHHSFAVSDQDGRLCWETSSRKLTREPATTAKRRLLARLTGLLPFEAQL